MTDSKATNDAEVAASKKRTTKAAAKKVNSPKAAKTETKSPETEDAKGNKPSKTLTAKTEKSSSPRNTTETKSTVETPNQMQVAEKKQGNSAAIFAIIFSLAALAGVAFTWYQNQVASVRSESGLAVGITEIGGQVSRIGDTVSRLQEQQSNIVSEEKLNSSLRQSAADFDQKLNQFNEKFEQVDEKFEQADEAQAQLLDSVTTINNDLKSGSNAYLVDEVAQLLKLANNSLVFSADPDSALNALTVAAAQLKSITDPRYSAVRVKIAEEIALLKNLELVDVEGMSASLNAISANIPSLPLENEPEATAVEFAEEPAEQESGWRAELTELWLEVKDSIQVQRVEQAPKPLLAPEQRYFLDQNLQLMLAKADLALLQERDAVFQQSLDGASKWLLDYFDTDDSEVKNVLAQLNEIRSNKVGIELPTITGSYEALQAIKGGQ
ncbi:MAG: uroporphyrinogen-III C-methyltransferase [Acidiferrobacterales bacterium]|nr:uroporphyrinogen-III C-methyltransferase [Acidiferrobacterales bacterium]